jgi:transcriptional regulator with XRE-family HTH domain
VTDRQHLLATLVLRLRSDLGLSQDDLAERAGVSRGWVSRVEIGDIKRPDPDVLDRVAAALGVSTANLRAAAGYKEASTATPEMSPLDLARQLLVKLERPDPLGLMDPELALALKEVGGDLTDEERDSIRPVRERALEETPKSLPVVDGNGTPPDASGR